MAIMDAIVGPVAKLLDRIIPDPEARDRAKLELIKLQGERYLRLAERRPANEAFLYGWLANRIGS